MKVFLILTVLAVFAVSCSTGPKPMYIWNGYSESLYELKKEYSEDALANHKEVLLSIIEDSKEEDQRVPPGVYAELGQILIQEKKIEEGKAYLMLEMETYPESKKIITYLLKEL